MSRFRKMSHMPRLPDLLTLDLINLHTDYIRRNRMRLCQTMIVSTTHCKIYITHLIQTNVIRTLEHESSSQVKINLENNSIIHGFQLFCCVCTGEYCYRCAGAWYNMCKCMDCLLKCPIENIQCSVC